MHTTGMLGCLVVGMGSLLFLFYLHHCVRVVRTRVPKDGPTPKISVLKPLKGAEPELYENLVSIATQDYPDFEIVFGCEDAMDPALAVARRVQREFPEVPMRLVAGGYAEGENPKVRNLTQIARAARHDWVLVSDADVRADRGYLRAMAAETGDPNVGLVSSIIAGVGERTLGGSLDNLHMNGFIASAVSGADVLVKHPCVVGKSMLFRKSVLNRMGGLGLVRDVLAEDYVLGQAFHREGLRVALSGHPVRAVAGDRTLSAFFTRHVRWGQMRRHIVPIHYIGEPLLMPTPWLFAAFLVALAPGRVMSRLDYWAAAFAVCALSVKTIADGVQTKYLRGYRADHADVALIPLKDLVLFGAWAVSWAKTTVTWRGTVLRIGRGSSLAPVSSRGRATAPSEAA
jgi:ceramide glucosyltransferase